MKNHKKGGYYFVLYYYREGQLRTSISYAPEVNIDVQKLSRVINGIFWETFAFSELGFDYDNAVRNFKFYEVKCWLDGNFTRYS